MKRLSRLGSEGTNCSLCGLRSTLSREELMRIRIEAIVTGAMRLSEANLREEVAQLVILDSSLGMQELAEGLDTVITRAVDWYRQHIPEQADQVEIELRTYVSFALKRGSDLQILACQRNNTCCPLHVSPN